MKMKYPGMHSYKYSLYIYGPYSTSVANDAYSLAKEIDTSNASFSAEESLILSKFDKMIQDISAKIKDLPKHTQLELLADIIHFNCEPDSIKNKALLFEKLVEKHSYFNNKLAFNIACDILIENKLISLE